MAITMTMTSNSYNKLQQQKTPKITTTTMMTTTREDTIATQTIVLISAMSNKREPHSKIG